MIHTQDQDFTLLCGDVLEELAGLPDESVHCVVTSPPYWGLRDYGTGLWDGGDPDCDHLGAPKQSHRSTLAGNGHGGDKPLSPSLQAQTEPFGTFCGKCGARRVDQQLGLEPTPELYVARIVEVFREVRRVLRADGTCWVNLGDSYASGEAGRNDGGREIQRHDGREAAPVSTKTPTERQRTGLKSGLKPKDLCGIPWRTAFALQADGWYLRSDIIWAKPNPMPESVTDRPTKAHEYVFLLTRSPRYYFDAEAVREQVAPSQVGRVRADNFGGTSWRERQQHSEGAVYRLERNGVAGQVGLDDLRLTREADEGGTVQPLADELLNGGEAADGLVDVSGADIDGDAEVGAEPGLGSSAHTDTIPQIVSNGGRNVRSVWDIATQPYPEAHFATYPEELVRRCVLAGSSERGCCPACGKPWEREVERMPVSASDGETAGRYSHDPGILSASSRGIGKSRQFYRSLGMEGPPPPQTLGWRPGCDHDHTPIPCTILDPFLGSGTTAYVARKHGRRSIGIELNPTYADLAARRMQQQSLLV